LQISQTLMYEPEINLQIMTCTTAFTVGAGISGRFAQPCREYACTLNTLPEVPALAAARVGKMPGSPQKV